MEICSDPEIPRWTRVPSPYTEEHARTWIEQTVREWDARQGEAAFAVTDAESREVVGAIGLRLLEHYSVRGSIGYWVAADARGRGVATNALRLVSRWALRELGLPRVELVTIPRTWHRSGSRRRPASCRRGYFAATSRCRAGGATA
jgi:RimJ/RimL family protein N-acetyltransferase